MTISAQSSGSIQIKVKHGNILLGDEVKICDFILEGAGEYEIAGIEVYGVGQLYIFSIEEMRVAYLDKLNRGLNDEEAEAATDVDILFIPVGGGEVLDSKGALAIINQLEPKIVVPMYYEKIEEFTDEEGIKPEFVESIKISRADLSEIERKVYVLPWKQSKKS